MSRDDVSRCKWVQWKRNSKSIGAARLQCSEKDGREPGKASGRGRTLRKSGGIVNALLGSVHLATSNRVSFYMKCFRPKGEYNKHSCSSTQPEKGNRSTSHPHPSDPCHYCSDICHFLYLCKVYVEQDRFHGEWKHQTCRRGQTGPSNGTGIAETCGATTCVFTEGLAKWRGKRRPWPPSGCLGQAAGGSARPTAEAKSHLLLEGHGGADGWSPGRQGNPDTKHTEANAKSKVSGGPDSRGRRGRLPRESGCLRWAWGDGFGRPQRAPECLGKETTWPQVGNHQVCSGNTCSLAESWGVGGRESQEAQWTCSVENLKYQTEV